MTLLLISLNGTKFGEDKVQAVTEEGEGTVSTW